MRKRVAGITAAVLVVGGVAGFAVATTRTSHALVAEDAKTTITAAPTCHVGDMEYYGLAGFKATGSHPIRVTKVEVLDLPAGLAVEKLVAVNTAETGDIGPLGAADQTDWVKWGYASVPTHPVTDMVLHPGQAKLDWWVALGLKVTKPGKQVTGGVRISYTAGGRHGTTTYRYQAGTDCK